MMKLNSDAPRLQPHSDEAEQSVLGAILLDNAALAHVKEILSKSDFYRTAHRIIYTAMLDLSEHGDAIDQITMTEHLKRTGELHAVGGSTYLAELIALVPTAANILSHARLVAADALRRQKIRESQKTLDESYGDAADRNEDVFFHETDLGNARRLVMQHGEDLRHSPELGWFVWTGQRWEPDLGKVLVGRKAEATVRAMHAEAATLTDKAERKWLIKHALRSESEASVRSMISAAERGCDIPVRLDQFDADPWCLNFLNGTVDLRTGTLRPHRREDLITKLSPVRYDPGATCPLWQAFLRRILDGDDAMIAFMQRGLGYSLSGDTREQVLFIPHGLGANGKSTLFSTFQQLLDDYATTTRADLLLAKRHDGEAPHELADLRGARFVWVMEAGAGRRLAEELIKALTGNDPIRARRLYCDGFVFTPTAKFWMPTNHRPIVRGTDLAIWRRLLLIPFAVTIPLHEQDKTLVEKLKAELPGILAWCVQGCLAWQQRGLDPPDAVKAATQEYRSEMDVVAAFLTESCVEDPGANETVGNLYDGYKEWAEKVGEPVMTRNLLTMKLKERGFERRKSGRQQFWHGLRLRLPGESDEATEPAQKEIVLNVG